MVKRWIVLVGQYALHGVYVSGKRSLIVQREGNQQFIPQGIDIDMVANPQLLGIKLDQLGDGLQGNAEGDIRFDACFEIVQGEPGAGV